MPHPRALLRRVVATGLLGSAVTSGSCEPPHTFPDQDGAAGSPRSTDVASRPVVVLADDSTVHLLAPLSERPLAYLSRKDRRVYIGRGLRDTAQQMLGAYISVSTDLWRIPLPGDDPRTPIVPGDDLREFEETALVRWDPRAPPAPGDIRIRGGAPTALSLELACVPVLGDGGWVSAGSLVLHRLGPTSPEPGREEFRRVGSATRHQHRDCRDRGEPVEILTWVALSP